MKKISKKIVSLVLAISMFSGITMSFAQAEKEAVPTTSTILINGKEIKIDVYNIEGNNYFKLRDLAYVLNGTETQFEVAYDATKNAISLTSGKPYTAVGGELKQGNAEAANCLATESKILKDGTEVTFTAYNINDNNYFKLRDVGEAFGFAVDWDESTNSVIVDTQERDNNMKKYYEIYKPADTVQINGVLNKLDDSVDKQGTIYGYLTDDKNNEWFVLLNIGYNVSIKEHYEPYLGKHITVTGTYEGYSEEYSIPCISMYELYDSDTGERKNGIRKIKEMVENGETIEKVYPTSSHVVFDYAFHIVFGFLHSHILDYDTYDVRDLGLL